MSNRFDPVAITTDLHIGGSTIVVRRGEEIATFYLLRNGDIVLNQYLGRSLAYDADNANPRRQSLNTVTKKDAISIVSHCAHDEAMSMRSAALEHANAMIGEAGVDHTLMRTRKEIEIYRTVLAVKRLREALDKEKDDADPHGLVWLRAGELAKVDSPEPSSHPWGHDFWKMEAGGSPFDLEEARDRAFFVIHGKPRRNEDSKDT